MVPFGDVARQGLEYEGAIDHGTKEERFALGLGLTVGGSITFLGGFSGEVIGGALSVTGVATAIGVPTVVVSAVAVVGGAANVQSGWALMVGEGAGSGGNGNTPPTTAAKGTQNPKVAAAARKGQQAHTAQQYPPGFKKEVQLPSKGRMDAFNEATKEVVELKPNNPAAIRKGLRQVEKYCNECDKVFGPGHSGKVETYE